MSAARAYAVPEESGLFPLLQPLASGNPESARDHIRDAVSAWRETKLAEARERFENEGNVARLLADLTGIMDETVAALYRLLMPGPHGVAVLATGGYGRREMFPCSDVDLLFLYRPATRAATERMARTMLYVLWDLGLKVGHAMRSLDEALALAQEDHTIATSLMDSRLVAGDAELAGEMASRYREQIAAVSASAFVEQKLAERDERHHRFMDSRYLLEPNIKESKGGLRNLHTLYWIARYAYGVDDIRQLVDLHYITAGEYRAFEKARRFLWELRAHLHYVAGKAEERLTFDRQQAIAQRMDVRGNTPTQTVERLMKRYFMTARDVGQFTRTLCAFLEESNKRRPRLPLAARVGNLWRLEGFTLDGERLTVRQDDAFEREPIRMLKLFAAAQSYGYDIHPRALQLLSRSLKRIDKTLRTDAKANAIFMDILLARVGAEQTLRRMNEAGLLGRFIPEFGRVVGQMQFNLYHIYTVDEHTIVALGNLHALEAGELRDDMPVASDVMRHVQSRRSLYLALLAHDLAKGGDEDHSEAGARLALKLGARFGLTAAESELVAWLVKHHLLFTHTAFKRDPNDSQTVHDFVGEVQTLERLRLLLCLTAADMRAVGPGVWNTWKATLLRNLYRKAENLICTGGEGIDAELPADSVFNGLRTLLPEASENDIRQYLSLCSPECLSGLEPQAHARVMGLLRQTGGEELKVDAEHDAARSVTVLTVMAPDQHALFSRLAGAIALAGVNITSAKIFTLKNGLAVDVFLVQGQDGLPLEDKERMARLRLRLRQALAGEIDIGREVAKQKTPYVSRRDAFQVEGQVFVENDASATHTVIEVVGRDRIGFLYAVTKALSDAGLTIGSAHISTYGTQAVDVFYVKDAFGMKVLHEKKQQELRQALLEQLSNAKGQTSKDKNQS